MAKATKQTKKFASSGKLKETIKKRRQYQQIQKKVAGRELRKERKERNGKGRHADDVSDDEEGSDEDDEVNQVGSSAAKKASSSKGKGKESLPSMTGENDDATSDDEDDSDVDDLEDVSEGEGEAENDDDDEVDVDAAEMAKSLAELEKKDPEFFKYLQENDAGLLNFDAEPTASRSKAQKKSKKQDEEEDDEEDVSMDEYDAPDSDDEEEEPELEMDQGASKARDEPQKQSVTMDMLRAWQSAMIEHKSLRSLRKMILAFRAAAHMNEDEEDRVETRYRIESAKVFNKLLLTALKFTPVVLAHHMPYKELPSGRFKTQPPAKSQATLPRFILSHFSTVMYLIKTLPADAASGEEEESLLRTVVAESTKILPWVMDARKQLKAYVKLLLDLWSSSSDNVRIACFLAVRRVYVAGDEAVKDLCLKGIYTALLPPLRLTTPHTLPALNLMKNSAAELYQLDPALSYQHAFGYIRMLAVHLRGVVRGQSDEAAFRAVYNWQFVHCIDFWSRVLSSSSAAEDSGENALEPLIYPLVQIALGVIRLVPTSRYFPLRFHIMHSLLRLISRTGTYIPLAPFCIDILESSEFKRARPKQSTLKPLDIEYYIRAPAAYPKTRVYQETIAEEMVYVLGQFFALESKSIAFPEMTIPVVATLKRYLKKHGKGKVGSQIKSLVDKIEATRSWVEKRRATVSFAPNDRQEVARFLEDVSVDATPLGGWMRLQTKVRDQKREQVERALREERGKGDAAMEESEDEEDDDDDDEELELSEDE